MFTFNKPNRLIIEAIRPEDLSPPESECPLRHVDEVSILFPDGSNILFYKKPNLWASIALAMAVVVTLWAVFGG